MSIPNEPAPLPAPPPNEGSVTFSSGGHQSFSGALADGIQKATLKEWKRVQSTFDGRVTEQFVWLFTVDGREAEGVLAYYTGTKVSSHPKAKLVPFLKAIGGRVPTPDNPRLPDDLPGRKVQLFGKNEPSTKDPSKSYFKVKEVLAA